MMTVFLWSQSIDGLCEGFAADESNASWFEGLEPARIQTVCDLKDISCNAPDAPVIVCGKCASSLDVGWHLVGENRLPVWGSILCTAQWAGRGRMLRRWISPEGNIYAAWHWPSAPEPWRRLTPLVLGYLVLRFVGSFGVYLKLKWPNDLLFEGKKIGGILVEERGGTILAGIGLNTGRLPDPQALERPRSIAMGALPELIPGHGPVSFWNQLTAYARAQWDSRFQDRNPAAFIKLIEPLLAFLHQRVRVVGGPEPIEGFIEGLNSDGGLRIARGVREDIIRSGSIEPIADS